jgi:drug/metabolite transporter (DMT)-like permease
METTAKERDGVSVGIGLTLLVVAIFGIQDATAKVLVQTWSPFQVTMMRYWAFGLFSLLIVARQAPLRQAFRSRMPALQVLRGVLLVADIWLYALAIRTVPLAELQSISLLYPLLVTLMAIPLLGEKVGRWRIGAVIAGFFGALIILRPGGLPFTADTAFAIASAFAYGGYLVVTRKVAQVDSTPTSMVYAGIVGMVMTTVVGIWFWMPMDWGGILLVIVVMATTVSAHSLMMAALKQAPASVLQPFNYLSLPWAIVLSAVVFGHFIDGISLIGATIIAGSGLLVWARERRKRTPPAAMEHGPHKY